MRLVCDFVRGVDRARFYPKFVRFEAFFCSRDDASWIRNVFDETKMHSGNPDEAPPGQVGLGGVFPRYAAASAVRLSSLAFAYPHDPLIEIYA